LRAATTRRSWRASSGSGRAATTQATIDTVLNEAGVICGPIYTVADIFEDPQFKARDMLLEHEDPEFGHYIGPGIVPKLSETPAVYEHDVTWPNYKGASAFLAKLRAEAARPG